MILMLLAVLFVTRSSAQPASAMIYCNRVNSPGVIGYKFSYGPIDRSYTNTIISPVTSAQLTNLVYGQQYFAFVKCFVSNGIESFPSPEITYVSVPASPTIIQTNLLFTGGPLVLQQSANLSTWQPVGTNYVYFTLPMLTSPGMWAYRIQSIGPVSIKQQP